MYLKQFDTPKSKKGARDLLEAVSALQDLVDKLNDDNLANELDDEDIESKGDGDKDSEGLLDGQKRMSGEEGIGDVAVEMIMGAAGTRTLGCTVGRGARGAITWAKVAGVAGCPGLTAWEKALYDTGYVIVVCCNLGK